MIYLYLFHGRKNPDEQMDDWGEDGPTLGPLQYVHTTYRDDIKVLAAGAADSVVLSTVGDCLYYDGMYYGDWSVYEADSPTRDLVQIDEAKATVPKVAKGPDSDAPSMTPRELLRNMLNMSDPHHPDFVDSGADVLQYMFENEAVVLAEKPSPKVLLEIDGGVLQRVWSDDLYLSVVLYDFDNAQSPEDLNVELNDAISDVFMHSIYFEEKE